MAIANEDIQRLSSVPGIGKKTAERLVLELRGKLSACGMVTMVGKVMPEGRGERADILNALLALGYSEKEATNAMKGLPAELTSVSDGIRLALKGLVR